MNASSADKTAQQNQQLTAKIVCDTRQKKKTFSCVQSFCNRICNAHQALLHLSSQQQQHNCPGLNRHAVHGTVEHCFFKD